MRSLTFRQCRDLRMGVICVDLGALVVSDKKAICRDCWNRYVCGLDYFEKGNRVFPSKEQCTDCVVVHNNWIVSREAKIYRFKEHFMWMYDKDSYYRYSTQTSSRYNIINMIDPSLQALICRSIRQFLASVTE